MLFATLITQYYSRRKKKSVTQQMINPDRCGSNTRRYGNPIHIIPADPQWRIPLDSSPKLFITDHMQQLTVQLYGRTAERNFEESVSATKRVYIGPAASQVELTLQAPSGEEFTALRLDPADEPSTFALIALSIKSRDGTDCYHWDQTIESLKSTVDLNISSSDGLVVLEATSNDPFLIIPLGKPQPWVHLKASFSSNLLDGDYRQLATAVLSLQSTLRSALDDLATEQDGIEETVRLGQTHARTELEQVRRITQVIGQSLQQVQSSLLTVEQQLDSKILDTGRTIERLQIEVGAIEQRLGSQVTEVANSMLELQSFVGAVEQRLGSQATEISGSAKDLRSRVGEVEQRLGSQIADVSGSVEELGSVVETIEKRLGLQVAEMSGSVKNLQSSVGEVEQRLGSQVAEVSDSVEGLESVVDIIEKRLSSQITEVSGSVEDLQSSVGAVEQRLEVDFADLGTAIERLQADVGAFHGRINSKFADVKLSVDGIQTHVGTVEQRVNASVADLRFSIDRLQSDVENLEKSLIAKLTSTAGEIRQEIFLEVRELWRSLRLQIEDGVQSALREKREHESALSGLLIAEFDKLTQAVHRLANSQTMLDEIRRQLGVSRDMDTLARLQQLTTRSQTRYSGLPSRLMRPLKTLMSALSET